MLRHYHSHYSLSFHNRHTPHLALRTLNRILYQHLADMQQQQKLLFLQVKFTNSSMSHLPKKKQTLTETSDFHEIDGTLWCFSDGSFLRKDEGICHFSLKNHQTHLNLLIVNLIPRRIFVSNSAHEAAAKNNLNTKPRLGSANVHKSGHLRDDVHAGLFGARWWDQNPWPRSLQPSTITLVSNSKRTTKCVLLEEGQIYRNYTCNRIFASKIFKSFWYSSTKIRMEKLPTSKMIKSQLWKFWNPWNWPSW